MPYLRGYQHDVFVSYAHGPKTNFCTTAENDFLSEWSRRLVSDLTSAVAVKLGTKDPERRVDLWVDAVLQGNHPLNETIQQRVENSALLIVIMSRFYLDSPWCGREV